MKPTLSLNRICFFVGPAGTDTASEHLVKGVLAPLLPSFGFELRRAAHVNNPHVARSSILRRLLDADLVAFDLSSQSADIAFDVGIRYASGRPLLTFISEGVQPCCALTHLDPIVYHPGDLERTATVTWPQLTASLDGIQRRALAGRPIFEHLGQPITLGGVPLTLENLRVVEEALKRRAGGQSIGGSGKAAASRPANSGRLSAKIFETAW